MIKSLEIHYRFLAKSDYSALQTLFLEQVFPNFGKDKPHERQKKFDRMLYMRQVKFELSVGAFYEGELAGFILMGLGKYNGKQTTYASGTGVSPKYRNLSIATNMLRFFAKELPKQGIEQALVTTAPRSIKRSVGRIYEKAGYAYQRNLQSFKILKESDYIPQLVDSQCEIVQVDQPNWALYDQIPKPLPCWERIRETVGLNAPHEVFFEAYQNKNFIGFLIADPTEGRIAELGVLPDYQETTALSELLQNFYTIAHHKLLRIIHIDLQEQYIIDSLLKLGFTKFSETEEFKIIFN